MRSHLRMRASIWAGPSLAQMRLSLLGSSQERKPLSRGSKATPAWAAWRLAHSLPLRHALAL